jgi:hypothetical protein
MAGVGSLLLFFQCLEILSFEVFVTLERCCHNIKSSVATNSKLPAQQVRKLFADYNESPEAYIQDHLAR